MTSFIGTDFSFNGISSTPYGIQLIKIDSGMVGTPIAGGKSVFQEFVPYKDKPFFYKTDMQAQEISMAFTCSATPAAFTSDYRKQIFEWLYSPRGYCDFISEDDTNKVYKIIFTSPLQFTTTNLTDGYFELNAIAYPFAYTALTTYTQIVSSTPTTIAINNLTNMQNYDGSYYYYPIVYADLSGGATSLKIVNTSDSNRVFEITALNTSESLYIDNALKIINSSVSGANRFATLTNKQWLRLVKGENILRVDTTCTLNIQCQYPILV